MSLIEELSKKSTNDKKHPAKEQWDAVMRGDENVSDIVNALKKGSDEFYEIQITEDVFLPIRLLTISEEAAVKSFVSTVLEYYPYSKIDDNKREEIKAIEELKIKLMMITTPPMKFGSTFFRYNAAAKLKYSDVSQLTLATLLEIAKEYQSLEARFNPHFEGMEESYVLQLIEYIKKQELKSKDLSYNALLTGFNLLIQENARMDKILSSSLTE